MTERKGMKTLPVELKDYIYDIAGPLAKYLHGRLDLSSNFNKRLIRRDAIGIGWKGDYSELFVGDKLISHKEVADIAINQSKQFHDWLIIHLKSNDQTRNILKRLEYLNWKEWWKDSISSCSHKELRGHFDSAIENTHVEMVRSIMTNDELKKRVLGDSGEGAGYFVEKFFWNCEEFSSNPEYAFEKSAQSKMLRIILSSVNINASNCAMDAAAMIGDMKLVKWVHENICDCCSAYAMDEAAANGHFDIVKWLHENRTEGCTTDAIDCAAENGHLEIVKWLHENRAEGCTTNAIEWAKDNGHVEVVKWLSENKPIGYDRSPY